MGMGEILSQNAKIRASRPSWGRGCYNLPIHKAKALMGVFEGLSRQPLVAFYILDEMSYNSNVGI